MKVDVGNPWLRLWLAELPATHQVFLGALCGRLPGWVAAARRRETALAELDGRPARPLAACVDLDEVLVCNMCENAFRAEPGEQGPDAVDFCVADLFVGPNGGRWPRDSPFCPLMPGARELLEALRGLGVATFIVTGRFEADRAETIENLALLGLAAEGPGALFRPSELARADWGLPLGPLVMRPEAERPEPRGPVRAYKEARRRTIEQTHRIVVNVGDQPSDLGLHGDVQVKVANEAYWLE